MSQGGRKIAFYNALRLAEEYLGQRARNKDRANVDAESVRVRDLARIKGTEASNLPTVQDNYARTGRIESLEDLEALKANLQEFVDEVFEDPDKFGVVLIDEDEEA